MNKFIYVLTTLTLGLVIYNITKLDFSNILQKDSKIALITILAGLCGIVLCLILLISKRIKQKLKN